MAVRYYGVAKGGHSPSDVTVQASSNSTDIELAVDDTNVARADPQSKRDILEGIEAIKLAVEQDLY